MCVTEYASDNALAAACFECSSGNFFRALCFVQLHFCCTSLLSRRRLCVCVCLSLSHLARSVFSFIHMRILFVLVLVWRPVSAELMIFIYFSIASEL